MTTIEIILVTDTGTGLFKEVFLRATEQLPLSLVEEIDRVLIKHGFFSAETDHGFSSWLNDLPTFDQATNVNALESMVVAIGHVPNIQIVPR